MTTENKSLITNGKWYSEDGIIYNDADDSVKIVILFETGSYCNFPKSVANKIVMILNNYKGD